MQPSEADRLRRIAFVTREYGRLRASIQSAFFVPFAVLAVQSERDGDSHAVFLWVLTLVLVGPAAAGLLHYWMQRRFGRVVKSERSEDAWRLFWLPLALGSAYSILEKLDTWALKAGRPSVLLMAAGAVVAWFAVRDWPHRKHLAIPVFACLSGAVILARPGSSEWRTVVELSVVASWISACVGDFILVRAVLAGPSRAQALRRLK